MKKKHSRRNRQIEKHLQLVGPIAHYYASRTGHDREDLNQVGMMGLILAAQNFKASSNAEFSAFARPHIRGAILHFLRDKVSLVKIPRRVEERAQKVLKQESQFGSSSPSEPLNQQDQLAVSYYSQKGRWMPLDEGMMASSLDQWSCLVNKDRTALLNNAVCRLSQQEQAALEHVVIKGESLRTAAKCLGVSSMTIQRRLKKALQQLAIDCQELKPGKS